MKGRISDEKVRLDAVRIIKETKYPVNVRFVAKKLGIAWATARALLMELLQEQKLDGFRTTNGWVFRPNPAEACES